MPESPSPRPAPKNVLLFIPRLASQRPAGGRGATHRGDLAAARIISQLTALRRQTRAGREWRRAVAAVELFLATLGVVGDFTVPSVVEASVGWTEPASADF